MFATKKSSTNPQFRLALEEAKAPGAESEEPVPPSKSKGGSSSAKKEKKEKETRGRKSNSSISSKKASRDDDEDDDDDDQVDDEDGDQDDGKQSKKRSVSSALIFFEFSTIALFTGAYRFFFLMCTSPGVCQVGLLGQRSASRVTRMKKTKTKTRRRLVIFDAVRPIQSG
jgi:hypothetical protein